MAHGHEAFAELTASYVLGSLPASEREAFEAHLATCDECANEVRSLAASADALAHVVPQVDPPPEVRDRVLKSVTGSVRPKAEAPSGPDLASGFGRTSSRASTVGGSARTSVVDLRWLAVAASLLVAVAAGAYAAQLRGRVSDLESQLDRAILRADAGERRLAEVVQTAAQAQSSVAVLTAPDLARIDLTGQSVSPAASARAFWSRSRGLVFTASNLPALPPGRTYQLWVITANPAPISAGLLKPDAGGRVAAVFDTPPDLPKPVAMAVTIEPEGGVASPTGDKYLVGTAD